MEYADKVVIDRVNNKGNKNISQKMMNQLKIILSLASIRGYDQSYRIRNSEGKFIKNSNIANLLEHAMKPQRRLVAENDFINLLREANIDPELILNDNIKVQLLSNEKMGNEEDMPPHLDRGDDQIYATYRNQPTRTWQIPDE